MKLVGCEDDETRSPTSFSSWVVHIGEVCYSVYRKPIHYKCPICEGNGKFLYNGYDIWCKNCNGSGKLHNPKQSVLDVCEVRIKRLKISICSDINTIRYVVDPIAPITANVKNRSENNLFKTKEEAEKYCVEVNIKEKIPEF